MSHTSETIYVNTLISKDSTRISSTRWRCIVCNSDTVWIKMKDTLEEGHHPLACSMECVNLYNCTPLAYKEYSSATLPSYTLGSLRFDCGRQWRPTSSLLLEENIPELPS